MQINSVHTQNACAPIGPYSQATCHAELIYCSGQIGLNSEGELPSSLEAQTKQIFENIEAVLVAAGSGVGSILRCVIYLTNMADFTEVNALYKDFVKEPYPARSTIEVSQLPKGALIEIEVTACKRMFT